MPKLPDPNAYTDPIRYFRACHALVSTLITELEHLTLQAEQQGVVASITQEQGWRDLLEFFVNVAPVHEMDEEAGLFPIVLERVPHIGFQHADTPMRYIQEQHEIMQAHSIELLRIWKQTLAKQEITAEDAARFISGAKELAAMYREHMRRENELIYTTANDDLLSPEDREAIMAVVRNNHSQEVVSPVLEYDEPTFSLKGYAPIMVQAEGEDAISDTMVELEDDDEEEEEEE